MISVRTTEAAEGWPPSAWRSMALGDLEPGADPGLDVICRGILDGTAFEYLPEDEARHPAAPPLAG